MGRRKAMADNKSDKGGGVQRMVIEGKGGFLMSMTEPHLATYLDNKDKITLPRTDRRQIRDEIVSRIYGPKK
jgi:hypothetical protein